MLNFLETFDQFNHLKLSTPQLSSQGRVTKIMGLALEVDGLKVAIGDVCEVRTTKGEFLDVEVVGFSSQAAYMMPLTRITNIVAGALVRPKKRNIEVPKGMSLLGRVIDGIGNPIDGKGELLNEEFIQIEGEIINPLNRKPISETLDVGVRAINGLFTVGKGQRMGLFAGSGVGKSVLLGMMTKFTEADIVVVGLIGERGREVKEFIDHNLGEEGRKRSIVVASPADDSPLMRLRATEMATRIAEGFRDEGKNVLLLMDSLTRYAQAQREIALAIGEPPATKGYPPSVFAKLPKIVERAGNGDEDGGSITAFYTVLTEGDDNQDPIADSARAILDGHLVLNRSLAEKGHYPAIDPEMSISRAMNQIVTEEKLKQAQWLRRLWSKYSENKELLTVGAYVAGADRESDVAIQAAPAMEAFLNQSFNEKINLENSDNDLNLIMTEVGNLLG